MTEDAGRPGVSTMEELLKGYSSFLESAGGCGSFCEDVLQEYDARECSLNSSLQIEAATEELQQLKLQFIELSTKERFLTKVATSGEQMPAPSMQELARAELAAEQQKSVLKKAKEHRKEEESKLQTLCRETAYESVRNTTTRTIFARKVGHALAATRYDTVRTVLENGDLKEICGLVENVDRLDAKACERILMNVYGEVEVGRTAVSRSEEETCALREEVHNLEQKRVEIQSQMKNFQKQIEESEKENANVPRLRTECAKQESLVVALTALTNTRVSRVYDGGIAMELIVSRQVHGATIRQERVYALDLQVGNLDNGFVTAVTLHPNDVPTESLVRGKYPLTVLQVTHAVIEALQNTAVDA